MSLPATYEQQREIQDVEDACSLCPLVKQCEARHSLFGTGCLVKEAQTERPADAIICDQEPIPF
jgi:hypothetical protein